MYFFGICLLILRYEFLSCIGICLAIYHLSLIYIFRHNNLELRLLVIDDFLTSSLWHSELIWLDKWITRTNILHLRSRLLDSSLPFSTTLNEPFYYWIGPIYEVLEVCLGWNVFLKNLTGLSCFKVSWLLGM